MRLKNFRAAPDYFLNHPSQEFALHEPALHDENSLPHNLACDPSYMNPCPVNPGRWRGERSQKS